MANIPFGDSTVSALQALNQYTTGLIGGFFVDKVMDQINVSEDNVPGRMGRQLLQVALNGILLNFMLGFLHGTRPPATYRDPTGGYMLIVGLVQSQQSFMKNGKDLTNGLTMFIREILQRKNLDAESADASKNPQ
jgi:hypothetical protein